MVVEVQFLEQIMIKQVENQRVLVVGPSGCGKTSLLRMVSGLWPPAAGEVERPPLLELLFIPQKPYMILGSLREQLCYPQDPQRFSDEHLRSVLEEVRLGALVQLAKECKQSKNKFLVVGNARVVQTVKLVRLEEFLHLQPDLPTALDKLAS